MNRSISEPNEEYIRISADDNTMITGLRELFRYRDLIFLFVKRSFMVRYKQTILGPLWLLLQPFITSLMYLFVFGGIANIDTDGVPGILFYIGSNAMWSFFASCLTSNAGTFTDNAYLFGKVYFPRLTIPVSNVINAALKFLIEMLLFSVFYLRFFLAGRVSGSLLFVPAVIVLLLHLGALGLSCGIILSSLTTRYRDLTILIGFGVSLWMYGSCVVYPLAALAHPVLRMIVLLNPVTAPMELFRHVLFQTPAPPVFCICTSWALTLLLLFAGTRLFSYVEKTFIDTV